MKFEYTPGATPLNLDEIEGLKPLHISSQVQLNEWEAVNIAKGERWAFSRKHKNFLTIDFIRKLHKKMFLDTWRWAGNFRDSFKTIGIDPSLISTELKKLMDDIDYQIINNSYSSDEIAYRFHHRLVAIHPFANGNGRHARTMTDLLLAQYGHERFSWGGNELNEGMNRKKYIAALKAADRHDYKLLSEFVRS